MQAANGNRRGVHIYGLAPDGRPFLPQMHGARRLWPHGLARLGNHGRGRIQSFVGALLLALPLLLTLQKFVELLPFGERSHQLFALPQVQQIQSLTHVLHSGRSLYRCRSFFFTAAMSFASSQMRSPQRCIAL